jgi:hypothetical protein
VRGRGAVKKVLIVVAVEDKGGHIGRIRLRRVPDGARALAAVLRRLTVANEPRAVSLQRRVGSIRVLGRDTHVVVQKLGREISTIRPHERLKF